MGILDSIVSGLQNLNSQNGPIANAMNSPLTQLGLSMMAAGTGVGNPGQTMLNNYGASLANQRARQQIGLAQQLDPLQVQSTQQQLTMQQLQMQRTMALLNAAGSLWGAPSAGAVPGTAASVGAPTGGLLGPAQSPPPAQQPSPSAGLLSAVPAPAPAGPGVATPANAAPTASATPAAPWWLTPITPQSIGSLPLPGGINPRAATVLSALQNGNPAQAASSVYAEQLKMAQQRYAPIVGTIDTVRQADNPWTLLQANPQLRAAWPQMAAAAGIDPTQQPTPQQVRTALTLERNQIASGLSEATVAPPVPLQTVPGGIGGVPRAQINSVTGQYTPITQPETANFVMPNGSIRMLPKAQGIAQGLTPYESDAYVSPGTQDTAELIADYKLAPLSGYALRTPQGQALMAAVRRANPDYDATQFDTKNRAREAFATGPQGDQVRRLDVSVDHLDTFGQLVDALNNHDVHAIAAVGQGFLRQFGSPAPTNFDAAKLFISNEITRGIIGGDAAEGDRKQVLDDLSRANSPTQLKGAISTFQRLLGGQLDGLRRQYKRATGLNDFDDALSPTALSQLPTPGATSTAPAAPSGAAAPGKVISWKDLP